MRRPYWKGFLKLSLVSCPVAMHSASSDTDRTHFHQINRKTGHRLRQQMIDEVTGEPVTREDKARGYEVEKGSYVKIEPEDLEAIQIEATHTIDIEKFVPEKEIDKRYYERPYYLVPDGKSGADAYSVIRDAMRNKGRVALARIVFANREHIVALEPWNKVMLCTTLRYDYEVRDEDELAEAVPGAKVSKEMVDLAAHILDTKAGKFDPSEFKDDYELALRKLVDQKAKGHVIQAAEPVRAQSNVIDLMDALRRSIDGAGNTDRKPRAAAAAIRKTPKKTSAPRKSATARKRRA